MEKGLKASRTKSRLNVPAINGVYDYSTKLYNQQLTSGNMGRITGRYLKFDPEDLQQGIFLTNEQEEEIRIEQIADNLPSRLTFIWPSQLPNGTFRVQVRVRKNDDTILNSVSVPLQVLEDNDV